jgi:hypothetical protein
MKEGRKMPKVIVVAAMVLAVSIGSSSGNAPTGRGSVMISGGGTFHRERVKSGENYQTATSLRMEPAAGVFVLPGCAVGIKSNYQKLTGSPFNSTVLGYGPFVSVFFPFPKSSSTVKEMKFPYPYLTLAYLWKTDKIRGITIDKIETLNCGLGLMAMIDDHAGIQIEGSYDFDNVDVSGLKKHGNKFNLLIGICLFLH